MPPKDSPEWQSGPENIPDNSTEEKTEEETGTEEEEYPNNPLYNYQIRYVDAETGETTTKLIEATHIVADDDHLELWWEDVAMLLIQKSALIQIRNVSLLDMPL